MDPEASAKAEIKPSDGSFLFSASVLVVLVGPSQPSTSFPVLFLLPLPILRDQECAPAAMGAEVWSRLLFPACELIPDQPGNPEEEAQPCLHPASRLHLVFIYRITEKAIAVNKHKFTSLLDLGEAKQQDSVQHVSVVLTSWSSRPDNIQGILTGTEAHWSFCINVQQFYSDLRCK